MLNTAVTRFTAPSLTTDKGTSSCDLFTKKVTKSASLSVAVTCSVVRYQIKNTLGTQMWNILVSVTMSGIIAQDLEVKRCLAERQFSEHFQVDVDLFNNILRVIREPNLCAHKN